MSGESITLAIIFLSSRCVEHSIMCLTSGVSMNSLSLYIGDAQQLRLRLWLAMTEDQDLKAGVSHSRGQHTFCDMRMMCLNLWFTSEFPQGGFPEDHKFPVLWSSLGGADPTGLGTTRSLALRCEELQMWDSDKDNVTYRSLSKPRKTSSHTQSHSWQ